MDEGLRAGVQAISFEVLRHLGRAEALRGLGLEVDEAPLLAAAHGRIIGTDQLISQVLEHPGAHEIPLLRPTFPAASARPWPS